MNDIGEIEEQRLHELEKQAARFGPQTDPAILIEIQELKHKRRAVTTATRRDFVSGLDYDFLMNVVAAALLRLGVVETNLNNNDRRRMLRQLIHDFWMIAMSVIVVITLILQLRGH